MSAVSDGKLDEVATALVEQSAKMTAYEADQAKNIDVIHRVMRNEVSQMHGVVTVLNTTIQSRMARIEQAADMQMTSAPSGERRQGSGGARGYQIRVPDPKIIEPDRVEEWRDWLSSLEEIF